MNDTGIGPYLNKRLMRALAVDPRASGTPAPEIEASDLLLLPPSKILTYECA